MATIPSPTINRPKPPTPTAAPAKRSVGTASGGSALLFRRETSTERIAPRIVLNCVEGWGKSTCGAQADNPLYLMASIETGYELLLQSGLVPEVSRAVSGSWPDTLATLDEVAASGKQHATIVLDALNGFERQAQEHVCATVFDGDWGERGFAAYAKGYELTAGEWVKLLARLDAIRAKGTTIILLAHCKIRPFKNPEGPDYDRYASNLHEKVWDMTKQWADLVGFGNFYTTVESDKGTKQRKGKAVGGDTRVLYTVRSAAYDAKNRFGMDAMIQMPDDYTKMWETIKNAMNRSNTNVE